MRFVDEVNEKISLIQESCLAIYNGFYCINEVLNTILFCTENLNRKFYSSLIEKINSESTYQNTPSSAPNSLPLSQSSTDTIQSKQNNTEKLQNEYSKNIIEKLESVRAIINQIMPLNYRLEILENVYSLIYLSCSDLKESEEKDDEDTDEDDADKTSQIFSEPEDKKFSLEPYESIGNTNNNDDFEIVDELTLANGNKIYDADFSIYGAGTNASKEQQVTNLKKNSNYSSKSTLGSYYSNGSNSSSRYNRQFSSNFGAEDDVYSKSKKSKMSIYRRNASGGGPFLVNDFLCRDILLLVKDLLQTFSSSLSQQKPAMAKSASSSSLLLNEETITNLNSINCSISNSKELNTRFSKLQQIVNETLWRFQIVKCDSVQIEFGHINNLSFDSQTARSVSDRQESLVFDLMKERKRRLSTASNVSTNLLESYKQDQLHSSLKQPKNDQYKSSQSRDVPRRRGTFTTGVSSYSSAAKPQRRSLESQRSLSLIYPMYKNKRSNMSVMKLLSNIETLSTLCLKEGKLTEANQLVKMYSSNKDACKSFEFREIIFYSVYKQTVEDLIKLNSKQQQGKESRQASKKQQNLIDMSIQSLDVAKLTENLLSLEKENELLKCIFLCDTIIVSKLDLPLAASLTDYARIKLNQNLISSNKAKAEHASDKAKLEKGSSDEEEVSARKPRRAKTGLENDSNNLNETLKFEDELKSKLSKFIESSEMVCSHFINSAQLDTSNDLLQDELFDDKEIEPQAKKKKKPLVDYLFSFDGLCFGLNGPFNKNGLFDNTQESLEKYESYLSFNKKLNIFKTKFENTPVVKLDESITQQHDMFFNIINLINQSIKLNENEDLISAYFFKPNSGLLNSHKQNYSLATSLANDSNDYFSNSIERLIYKNNMKTENISSNSITSLSSKNSNYLLSFYEYCKTLYEYFKEKSLGSSSAPQLVNNVSNSSFFSILDSSPASLICKLLFEDSIKPQSLESLTQKLNLNLTAIILHNSCPRLKLTLVTKHPILLTMNTNKSITSSRNTLEISANEHNSEAQLNDFNKLHTARYCERQMSLSDVSVYNLNSFYTILNDSDVFYCSRKKPDEFLKDLLLKLLKFTKKHLSNMNSQREKSEPSTSPLTSSFNNSILQDSSSRKQFIDLGIAKEIYQSAELKSILNESKELQHLNLNFLKTDNQKLSFFINLYNLLSIHSHFYLASKTTPPTNDQNKPLKHDDALLFRNKTERMLFEQRMCYKVSCKIFVNILGFFYRNQIKHFEKNRFFGGFRF